MKITTVLFDLDGTLLPMDQDEFVKAYFGLLAKKVAPLGYDGDRLIKAIWGGTAAMVKNDGSMLNEEVFWQHFCMVFGQEALQNKPHFDAFYQNEFQQVQKRCGFAPEAAPLIRWIRSQGLRVALATNPLFPSVATHSRIRWAGLTPDDFELCTTYENAHFSKPCLRYYQEILHTLGVCAEECLMVGNDVGEDMVASQLGMRVFLMTDCLINRENADTSQYPQGSFSDLKDYMRRLLA